MGQNSSRGEEAEDAAVALPGPEVCTITGKVIDAPVQTICIPGRVTWLA